MTTRKRCGIISGPACVGKGPTQRAIERIRPGLLSARPVICHSRRPRENEIHGLHYYFMPLSAIRSLQTSTDFIARQVRNDWQALDLAGVEALLGTNDLVFAEVFHTFCMPLQEKAAARSFDVASIFLLPLPLGTPDKTVVATMLAKLERRDTEGNAEQHVRATSAPTEMASAPHFTHQLLNPVGEDCVEEWGDCGTFKGSPGSRKIRGLADLGPNAKWLVRTILNILDGNLAPGSYSQ